MNIRLGAGCLERWNSMPIFVLFGQKYQLTLNKISSCVAFTLHLFEKVWTKTSHEMYTIQIEIMVSWLGGRWQRYLVSVRKGGLKPVTLFKCRAPTTLENFHFLTTARNHHLWGVIDFILSIRTREQTFKWTPYFALTIHSEESFRTIFAWIQLARINRNNISIYIYIGILFPFHQFWKYTVNMGAMCVKITVVFLFQFPFWRPFPNQSGSFSKNKRK